VTHTVHTFSSSMW